MKALGLQRNKKYRQGYYKPTNPEKYIGTKMPIYRSGLELKYFKFLDHSENCLAWTSETVTVPYFSEFDKKWHTYYIDLKATFRGEDKNVTYLIEVKPYRQTIAPKPTPRKRKKTLLYEQVNYTKNISKWRSAKKYAETKGMKFIIVTENEIS